jgi:prepilin-type N-terminal cleavage/methylation domain-containing protein
MDQIINLALTFTKRMHKHLIFNPRGFTLIEIIAVLIILSTLAAMAIPRFINLDANAKDRAIDSGISEINGRESLVWADIKVSPAGWSDDATLFTAGRLLLQRVAEVSVSNPALPLCS